MGTDVEGISTTSSIILPLASFDADPLGGMMLYVDDSGETLQNTGKQAYRLGSIIVQWTVWEEIVRSWLKSDG